MPNASRVVRAPSNESNRLNMQPTGSGSEANRRVHWIDQSIDDTSASDSPLETHSASPAAPYRDESSDQDESADLDESRDISDAKSDREPTDNSRSSGSEVSDSSEDESDGSSSDSSRPSSGSEADSTSSESSSDDTTSSEDEDETSSEEGARTTSLLSGLARIFRGLSCLIAQGNPETSSDEEESDVESEESSDYSSSSEEEISEDELKQRKAEDEQRATCESTALLGACTICHDSNVVEPAVCKKCKNLVGCLTCVARWMRAAKHPQCPLCRERWTEDADRAIAVRLLY